MLNEDMKLPVNTYKKSYGFFLTIALLLTVSKLREMSPFNPEMPEYPGSRTLYWL